MADAESRGQANAGTSGRSVAKKHGVRLGRWEPRRRAYVLASKPWGMARRRDGQRRGAAS
jgi:hypothetical protein